MNIVKIVILSRENEILKIRSQNQDKWGKKIRVGGGANSNPESGQKCHSRVGYMVSNVDKGGHCG